MAAKLLIAAGQAAADPAELPDTVKKLISSAEEVLVIAPTLPGRFEWLASATDEAREQADERLQTVLGQVSEVSGSGSTQGAVAADDPMLAFDDAVAEFEPDHILIGLRSAERSGWQERGLLDQLVERYSVPITVFHLGSTVRRRA
jgi:hypothetical protein